MTAIASMIADDRPVGEVVQQILAARASLDSLLLRLVELELRDCLPAGEARREVDALLRTALGHAAPGRRGLSRTPRGLAIDEHIPNSHGGAAT